ncbi:MAG: GTPase/DUF3482 domain-containing protein [Desulfobacteraceae bacterium]|nr:GTPase/DUF3482 domain-containing protein [Desulfobacteraceae bacterium]
MSVKDVPEFAILGHPNEGKSSVVSTLAENDRVRIGPYPGETVHCQTFPVTIDRTEVIRFTDTPGFQNPKQTLRWFENYKGSQDGMVEAFIEAHRDDPSFRDECELLSPVARGAGIIYVVDGSRPVRGDDRAEMEILRLTGRPRMSIINCKEDDTLYLDAWKNEFRRTFNSIREFNAHRATYRERIELLECLKSVDQDWQEALTRVIHAFKRNWGHRMEHTSLIIVTMVEEILGATSEGTLGEGADPKALRAELEKKFLNKVKGIENNAHADIRRLFKHNIFNVKLPRNSLLNEDLFSETTWKFLGLSPKEVAVAAGVAGAGAGAIVDTAAAGLTFGIFSTLGGVAGAAAAILGGSRIAGLKLKGVRLGKDQIIVRPAPNAQFMYVLLDRAFLFYSSVINWAHGRRDYNDHDKGEAKDAGVIQAWDKETKKICNEFFKKTLAGTGRRRDEARTAMVNRITERLRQV